MAQSWSCRNPDPGSNKGENKLIGCIGALNANLSRSFDKFPWDLTMLDGVMRKLIDPPLNRVGRKLAGLGVSANALTLGGLLVGLAAATFIAFEQYWIGLALIGISRIADGLDGAVARATQKTDFGGYFDIIADFLFYGAIPLAFAFANPGVNALAAGVLLLAFYVNGATFLGFSILAERRKLTTTRGGEKNLYFSEGLLEGTETIALFFAMCIWPGWFVPMAAVFAVLALFTAFMRSLRAYRLFAGPAKDEKG